VIIEVPLSGILTWFSLISSLIGFMLMLKQKKLYLKKGDSNSETRIDTKRITRPVDSFSFSIPETKFYRSGLILIVIAIIAQMLGLVLVNKVSILIPFIK
jgi:hypothetical protein